MGEAPVAVIAYEYVSWATAESVRLLVIAGLVPPGLITMFRFWLSDPWAFVTDIPATVAPCATGVPNINPELIERPEGNPVAEYAKGANPLTVI